MHQHPQHGYADAQGEAVGMFPDAALQPWPMQAQQVPQPAQHAHAFAQAQMPSPGVPIGLPGQPLGGVHAFQQVAEELVQPRTWSYPTPYQPQYLQQAAPGRNPYAMQPVLAPITMVQRTRWEVILPALAAILVLAAVGYFIRDAQRASERTAKRAPAKHHAARQDAARDADTTPKRDDANAQDPAVSELLMQIGRERAEGQWDRVVASLDRLGTMTGLSPQLRRLRTRAEVESSVDRTVARAGALVAAGRDAEARALLDRANKRTPHRRLQAMRAKLGATSRRSRASRRTASSMRSMPAHGSTDARASTHSDNMPHDMAAMPGMSSAQPPAAGAPAGGPPAVRPSSNPVVDGGGGVGIAPG